MNRLFVNTSLSFLKPYQLQVGYGFVLLSTQQQKTFFNVSRKQITEIRDNPIRVYETKFRQNYCPHYWTVRDYCYDRIWKAVDPNQMSSARNSVYGSISDVLTSFFFPMCKSADHLVTLIELNCFYFMTDDYIGVENTKQAFDELLHVMIGKKEPEKPNEIIIAGINRNIRQYYSDKQYKQYIDSQTKYLTDCSNELESREKLFNDVEDMIEFRDNLIGARPYLDLISYALEIDVTEYADNPILNRMKSLIVRHVMLCNDVYSIKKELAERESVTPFNALLLAYSLLNNLEESVNKIFKILVSYENEFFELRKVLCAQYPNRSELYQYMDGLEQFAGGLLISTLCSPRYHNNYSLKDVVFKDRFTELIPEAKRNAKQYTKQYNWFTV